MSGIMSNGNAKAAQFTQTLKETQNKYNPAAREQVGDRANNPNSLFPVKLGDSDPQDDKYKRRAALMNPTTGVVPGVGQAIAPEEYFEYIKRKEDESQYTNFKEWIFKNADLSTPETAAYWTNLFPFIKEKMYAEIEREADLQASLAKISATGPQTEHDWYLLYCLQQGLIKPYDTPLYMMNDTSKQPYRPGLFSIFNLGPIRTATPVVGYKDPLNPRAQSPGSAMPSGGVANTFAEGTPTPQSVSQVSGYFTPFKIFSK